jgi:MFS family permease
VDDRLPAAGALLTALFVLAEHRARDPVVPLGLFRDRNFTADSLILFGTQAALIAATTFGAIFLQNIVGYSPVEAGLALLPIIVPILVVRGYVGRLFDRVGVRTPTRIGTVLCAAGLFLTAPAVAAASFPWMIPGSVVLGTGLGFVMTPTNADALSRAPDALRGAASGVVNTMRQVGGSIGLAVIGTVIATVESSRVADIVSAAGGSAADQDALSGVLSELEDGRRAAVESLPAADAGVIAQVEDAVAQSIAVGYCVGGAILAGCAVVAFTLMTGGRQSAEAVAPAPGHG